MVVANNRSNSYKNSSSGSHIYSQETTEMGAAACSSQCICGPNEDENDLLEEQRVITVKGNFQMVTAVREYNIL